MLDRFRVGYLTTTATADIYDALLSNRRKQNDENAYLCNFLELQKVFDCVDHKIRIPQGSTLVFALY